MSNPPIKPEDRRRVAKLAGGCCEYCKCPARFSTDPFSIDHIVPRSKGGTNELDNLAWACQGCNNRKYVSIDAIDPVTGETAPLFHPRRQSWTDHFAWNEDLIRVIGLTPTGRATVGKLKINRDEIINLRRVLVAAGEHPPLGTTIDDLPE